jgi:hypothetical protein
VKNPLKTAAAPFAMAAVVLTCASPKNNAPNLEKPDYGDIDIHLTGSLGGVWKNGALQYRIGPSGDYGWCFGNSVFVSGGDVYVAGTDRGNFPNNHAVLWKNNEWRSLSSGSGWASANSVFVSDGKEYVAGYEENNGVSVATLWVNGEAQRLSDSGWNSNAYSVCVSGGDVYVAGEDETHAVLWENGAPRRLELEGSGRYAHAYSVCVSNGDVYVAGTDFDGWPRAIQWKNGVASYLQGNADALSISVEGYDVYVAGNTKDTSGDFVAMLWKNGKAQRLGEPDISTYARSVFALNGNTYVTGYETKDSRDQPMLWINGKTHRLAKDGWNGTAVSVFVTKSPK